jgi:hypothetical protein
MKNPTISITITEKELCREFGLLKVQTAKWIGTKGNRKIVIYGVK